MVLVLACAVGQSWQAEQCWTEQPNEGTLIATALHCQFPLVAGHPCHQGEWWSVQFTFVPVFVKQWDSECHVWWSVLSLFGCDKFLFDWVQIWFDCCMYACMDRSMQMMLLVNVCLILQCLSKSLVWIKERNTFNDSADKEN